MLLIRFKGFILIMFNFYEPLEQFEIVKIGYEWWTDHSSILTILNFLNTSIISNWSQKAIFLEWTSILPKIFYNYQSKDIIGILSFSNNIYCPKNTLLDILYLDFFDSFVFHPLFWGINLNSTILYFLLLLFLILFLFLPIINNLLLIPTTWQVSFEGLYKFVEDMLDAQIGKEAQRFFPYVFSIFIFILVSNILGMTLFSFTLTSHIMVTFTLGVSSFIGLTILGFVIQNLAFLNLFLPKGIPTALIPMLVIIEIISYFLRALSLSVRLFANLMSGHILLHILAFFSSKLFKVQFFIGLVSFILILAIVALEFCIAILQAYVFAILICIYLNDSFHASH